MPVPCPVCCGRMPSSRFANRTWLMCRRCWRLVPIALRKENRRYNEIAKAAGWPQKPAPASLHQGLSENCRQCTRAAVAARHGATTASPPTATARRAPRKQRC